MSKSLKKKFVNIVIPMAGKGSRFQEAGYAFPKPLIDINGKTMIEVVVDNLRPKIDHRFIFICNKEHAEKYDLHNILKNVSRNKFEVVLNTATTGAATAVLTANQYINNDDELIIANSDQYINYDINDFVKKGRVKGDGLIMTFKASHPKWSYARTNTKGEVLEVAEKRVISDKATVGIYYYKKGRDFVEAAQQMIQKNIRLNNEFYVCPVYNEMILSDKKIYVKNIPIKDMHGLGTPEDLKPFLEKVETGKIKI